MPRKSKSSVTVIDQGEIDVIEEDLFPEAPPEGVMIDGVPHTRHPYESDPPEEAEPTEADVIAFEQATPSVEVGGDLEQAVAEEVANGEAEKTPIEFHVGDGATTVTGLDPGTAYTFKVNKATGETTILDSTPPTSEPEDDDDSTALKLALADLYDVQDRLTQAISDHAAKARTAKAAKERVETLQEDFYGAVTRLRDRNKPLPLFDRRNATTGPPGHQDATPPTSDPAKLEINALFPAPEAIQPTAPEDFAEALRRKQRDTPISGLGLTSGVEKIIVEDLGLKTVLDLVNKFNAVIEAGAPLTTIKGITATRLEKITEALTALTDAAQAEWDVLHPEDNPGFEETPEPSDGDTAEFEPLTEEGDADASA